MTNIEKTLKEKDLVYLVGVFTSGSKKKNNNILTEIKYGVRTHNVSNLIRLRVRVPRNFFI